MKKLLSILLGGIVFSLSTSVFADTGDMPVELFNNNGCIIMRTNEYQILTGFEGAVEFDGLTGSYYITGCSAFGGNYPIVVDTNNNQIIDPCQLEGGPNSADAVCRTKDSLMTPIFSSYESLQFVINQHKPRVNVLQGTVFDFFAGTANAKYMYYFGNGSYRFQYDTSDSRYTNLLATGYVLHTGYTGTISPYISLPVASSFAPIAIQSTNTATNYYGPTYFFHRIPVIKLSGGTSYKEVLLPFGGYLIPQVSVVYETITRKVIKKKRLTLPKS